jgi:hypothetical protein
MRSSALAVCVFGLSWALSACAGNTGDTAEGEGAGETSDAIQANPDGVPHTVTVRRTWSALGPTLLTVRMTPKETLRLEVHAARSSSVDTKAAFSLGVAGGDATYQEALEHYRAAERNFIDQCPQLGRDPKCETLRSMRDDRWKTLMRVGVDHSETKFGAPVPVGSAPAVLQITASYKGEYVFEIDVDSQRDLKASYVLRRLN